MHAQSLSLDVSTKGNKDLLMVFNENQKPKKNKIFDLVKLKFPKVPKLDSINKERYSNDPDPYMIMGNNDDLKETNKSIDKTPPSKYSW